MNGFQAIVLVCLASVPSDQCNEQNAVSILSTHVASEIGCMIGWQDVIARGALALGAGRTTYLRTMCRRSTTP